MDDEIANLDNEKFNPTGDIEFDDLMDGFLDPDGAAPVQAEAAMSTDQDLAPAPSRRAARPALRQPVDEAHHLVIESPVEPAKTNMAGFESMLELAKIGKTKGAMARLDAYLDKIPKENRELALSMMVDFGWSPNDPEIVNLMVWAHIVAAGKTIGVAIDSSVADAVERLAGVVASADDVRESIIAVLEEARGLNAQFHAQSQSQTDAIAQRVAESMRESAIAMAAKVEEMVGAAKASALAEIAAKTAEAEARLATAASEAVKGFDQVPIKLAAEIMNLVKSASMLSGARHEALPNRNERWRIAAAVGFLNGAAVAIALWAMFH